MANKLYNMTPKEIVAVLDKYIIGQDDAKKSVAVALRNRYRRSLLSEELQEEITPKNILMMGPTGVGKTEIARRLAKLMDAPFVKVEATKFTEVGYVGRDVDSMIRDLAEAAIRLTKQSKLEEKYAVADRMTFCLSDGVSSLPRDFDCLVCAGMGADTMISILSAAPWLQDSRYHFILQCQSKTPALRRYLTDQGYSIRRETLARGAGT